MTADKTSDIEAAPKAAPKNTRRSTTKTTSRKKTSLSADVALAEDTTSTAEKKKTPAKRSRKKPLVSSTSPISSLEGQAQSPVAQQENNDTVKAVPKPRATRAKSLSARAKKSTVPQSTEGLDAEKNTTSPMETSEQNTASQELFPKDPVNSAVPKVGRGRPKKVRDVEPISVETPLDSMSSFSDEPQSAGIERTATEVPDMPGRDEKRTRRPRRSVKAKSLSVVAESTEKNQKNISEITPESAQENIQESTQEGPSEPPYEGAEQEEHSAASPKSRRGRRGGRGKRGKKRPLMQSEEVQEYFEDMEEEEAFQSKKSSAIAKTGTSLGEGKPGRARTLPVKKGVENVQRKMFISMVQGEQVEVALVENGIIHEYYLEMLHQVKTKGNIYKGVVNNIDANLQAAFINYGANKNGFLQIDEIHPEYYQAHHETPKGKKFPPIQKIIKPGQEILVQVVKEPTGNKGAFLTTWLSLPGRFLVLTPGQEQIGISRKVESDEERGRLREMMSGIEPGAGLGVIVRTVSAGTSKTTLKSDLQYLKRVWKEIRKRGVSDAAPVLLYRESSLAERAIRDYLTDDVTEVWVDNTEVAESLRETVALLFPKKKELIRMHADVRQTLWERFNMHRQLEQIYAREVVLPSGGRLVFDQTEALMAIDINSGKISGKGNFESMALKTNIEAAEAIARHLKLRDIGGQVVIDFIEMRDKSHVREVEKTLRNAMKNDRARHDVARISSFGLLEIVRQRTGSSALAITMEPCPHCRGTGVRRNLEWQALQALCEMERKGRSAQQGKYVYDTNSAELAMYLLNHKRQRITELEEQLQISIEIRLQ